MRKLKTPEEIIGRAEILSDDITKWSEQEIKLMIIAAQRDALECNAEEVEKLKAQNSDIKNIGSLKTIQQLLDKLDYAVELLNEAKDANFNSNLGTRIKSFLSTINKSQNENT